MGLSCMLKPKLLLSWPRAQDTGKQEPHPAHVGLKDFLLPAAHVDALLVHVQRLWDVAHQVQRLGQVEDHARVVRLLLVLRRQQRQVQLRSHDPTVSIETPYRHADTSHSDTGCQLDMISSALLPTIQGSWQ